MKGLEEIVKVLEDGIKMGQKRSTYVCYYNSAAKGVYTFNYLKFTKYV